MPETTYRPLTAEEFNADAPEYRGIPLVEDENADYVIAFGHVDKTAMAAAVNTYDIEDGGVDPADAVYSESDVQHLYAVTWRPADDPDGWCIRWGSPNGVPVAADAPGAFAVTVVTR